MRTWRVSDSFSDLTTWRMRCMASLVVVTANLPVPWLIAMDDPGTAATICCRLFMNELKMSSDPASSMRKFDWELPVAPVVLLAPEVEPPCKFIAKSLLPSRAAISKVSVT